MAHLILWGNRIEVAGAESLTAVLAQCTALAHLDLRRNDIGAGDAGAQRLKESWSGSEGGLLLKSQVSGGGRATRRSRIGGGVGLLY